MRLRESDRTEVQNRLKAMKEPVSLVFFTQQIAGVCRTCFDAERLLKDVAPLSDKLSLQIKNFVTDVEDVRGYGVDKIPAICPVGGKDHGIRMYGIPSGYEFMAFLEILLLLSARESGLAETAKTSLRALTRPVHLQVFITPTCPHCPRAAVTAVQLAMDSDRVSCDLV
jgi:glutaredoxin-like protein